MEMINYYKDVLRKYTVFTGRSRRREYWYFALMSVIIGVVLGIFGDMGKLINNVYTLLVLIPSIAVGVRRLHDTGRSGWWLLLGLIPIVGWIIVIVWLATDGQPGANQYGPNPKEVTAASVSVPTSVPPSAPQV